MPLAAGDGSGWESHHVSHYYVNRRASCSKYWQKTTYARFPKAGVLCDCASHLILAIVPTRGPGPDIKHFRALLDQGLQRLPIDTAAFDAGYDAEHAHEYARDERGVRTLIPATIGRPTAKRLKGYWRRQMKSRLHLTRYGQRWQVETVNSMLKRLQGSALRARQLLESMPRNDPPSNHPQRHDSQTNQGFLRSIPDTLSPRGRAGDETRTRDIQLGKRYWTQPKTT